MAKYTINDTTLVAIADAIRAKSGTTGGIDPADMAALIAAIEAGGGGGDILGHKFACGSFTLTEDMTSKYTILTGDELFEAIKEDFPGAVKITSNVYTRTKSGSHFLHYYLAAICWLENVDTFTGRNLNPKEWLASFLPKVRLNDSNNTLAYTDNYGTFMARSGGTNGVKIEGSGFTVGFSSSYMGYAGSKYNWVVFPVDHGEVAGS